MIWAQFKYNQCFYLISLVVMSKIAALATWCSDDFISAEVLKQSDLIVWSSGGGNIRLSETVSSCAIMINPLETISLDQLQLSKDTILIFKASSYDISVVLNKICHYTFHQGRVNFLIRIQNESSTFLSESSQILLQSCVDKWIMPRIIFLLEASNSSSMMATAPRQNINVVKIFSVQNYLEFVHQTLNLPLTLENLNRLLWIPGDFQNIKIKVTGEPLESVNAHELVTGTNENGEFEFLNGFEYDLIGYLGTALNFSFIPVRGNGWTRPGPNGTLLGMGGQVLRKEADMGLTQSEYLPYRLELLTFLIPTFSSPISVFLVAKSSLQYKDVTSGLEFPVWLLIFASAGVSALFISGFIHFKSKFKPVSTNDREVSNDVGITTTGVACQQGSHIYPDSTSVRLVILSGEMASLACFMVFTAALVSILSFDRPLIRDLSELMKFQYSVYRDKDVLVGEIYLRDLNAKSTALNLLDYSLNMFDAFGRLYSETAAVITFVENFYARMREYFLENLTSYSMTSATDVEYKICRDIQELPLDRMPVQSGMFLRKKSAMEPYLNQKIGILVERGLKNRYLTTYYKANRILCTTIDAGQVKPMELTNVWVAFSFLLIGFIPSLTIMVLENVVRNRSRICMFRGYLL